MMPDNARGYEVALGHWAFAADILLNYDEVGCRDLTLRNTGPHCGWPASAGASSNRGSTSIALLNS